MSRCVGSELKFGVALVAVALLVGLVHPSPASAEDPSKEEVERFQGHLSEGGKLVEKQQYEDGIIELKRARRIIDHPKISLSIAGAYSKWGRCEKARQEYTKLVARENLDRSVKDKAVEGLEGLDQCESKGALVIRCTPEDAIVRIDEGSKLACPVGTELEVGEHQVAVASEGHEPRTEKVEIESGETTRVSVALRPMASQTTVAKEDEDTTKKEKKVVEPTVPEPVEPAWVDWVSYPSMIVGTGLIGLGVYNDLGSVARTDELAGAQEEGDRQSLDRLETDADDAYTRSIIFYSSGAALLATGIVLQVVDFSSGTESGARATVGVSATGVKARVDW